MPLPTEAKVLMPRECAAAIEAAWHRKGKQITDTELTKGVAVGGSESNLNVGAWHDNIVNNKITSRDCGWPQINISALQIGTLLEAKYRTVSKDPLIYEPVVRNCADAMYVKYHQTMIRKGKPDLRRWQAWFGYTLGWATFPAWWVWEHGTGPWVKTGRYVQKAIPGVANHYLLDKGADTQEALMIGASIQAQFDIVGTLGIDKKRGIVVWTYTPPKPLSPPADGIGPRPIPNDGR